MTEEEARAICRELGATLSIRQRRGKGYIFVSRWLPRAASEAAGHQASSSSGQQFDRYVGPLTQIAQLDADSLRQRIAALPLNPNKDTTKPSARPELAAAPASPAFYELLVTIPPQRTPILRWAKVAGASLKIPREQISYRLAFYRVQLAGHGVRMAQSTRYRTLFVPTLDTDSGGYYSHIWREP